MDLGIIAAIALLVLWGVGTFAFEAPGYIHGLLSAGLFLLFWRIVMKQDAAMASGDDAQTVPAGKGGKGGNSRKR
jgi:hypothetical protein